MAGAAGLNLLALGDDVARRLGQNVALVRWSGLVAITLRGAAGGHAAGRIVASGTPDQVLTEDLLRDVFGLDARVVPDPVAGTTMVVPIRRAGRVDPARHL